MKRVKVSAKTVAFIGTIILIVAIISGCSSTSDMPTNMSHAEQEILHTADLMVKQCEDALTDVFQDEENYPETDFVVTEREEDRELFTMKVQGYPSLWLSMWFVKGYDSSDGEIYAPPMKNLKPMPKDQEKLFENAKQLVKEYVRQSEVIRDEDKEPCVAHLDSVEVHWGEMIFEEGVPTDIVMLTSGENFNQIYVNNKMKSNIVLHTFVHELIHVVSRYTNRNCPEENSFYYLGFIPEAVTDLIAVSICQEVGEKPITTQYSYAYKPALMLIGKFGMGFYFYNDELEAILTDWGKLKVDLFMGLATYAHDELNDKMPLFLL